MVLHAAWKRFRLCVGGFAVVAVLSPCPANAQQACSRVDYNRAIVEIIQSFPKGGGYEANPDRVVLPDVSVRETGGRLEMRVRDGNPSHCSSAAYTVFAYLAARLQNAGDITLNGEQIASLAADKTMPDGTPLVDGQGPFWIFNANGSGAAALLHHTGTGFSFRDPMLQRARAGDFLKIFWNGSVGASEKGHQVIYTGHRMIAGRDMVCFWGSQHQGEKLRAGRKEPLYFPASAGGNVYDGTGEACRPREDIVSMIFSRVTCMEHLPAGLDAMKAKALARGSAPGGMPYLFVDDYLYKLHDMSSDQATLDRAYGILRAEDVGETGTVGRGR